MKCWRARLTQAESYIHPSVGARQEDQSPSAKKKKKKKKKKESEDSMAESEAAGCWNAATGLIASEWMRIARTRLRRGRGLAFNRFASTWPRHRGRASRPRPTPQNASERSPGKERRISNQSKNMGKWLHKRTKCCLPHTQTTKDLFLLLLSRRCVFSRSAKSVGLCNFWPFHCTVNFFSILPSGPPNIIKARRERHHWFNVRFALGSSSSSSYLPFYTFSTVGGRKEG